MTRHINNLLPALVLVRIGQELGTASPAARLIHDLLEPVSYTHLTLPTKA